MRAGAQVFIHRLRKYLGAYLIQLEGKTDAIVFSAGMNRMLSVGRAHACCFASARQCSE